MPLVLWPEGIVADGILQSWVDSDSCQDTKDELSVDG